MVSALHGGVPSWAAGTRNQQTLTVSARDGLATLGPWHVRARLSAGQRPHHAMTGEQLAEGIGVQSLSPHPAHETQS